MELDENEGSYKSQETWWLCSAVGTFLEVQGLRPHASTAGGPHSSPGWRTKIPHSFMEKKQKQKPTTPQTTTTKKRAFEEKQNKNEFCCE